MKKQFLLFSFIFSFFCINAQTLDRSMLIDFGPVASPGISTASSDANGIYWNNQNALTAGSTTALNDTTNVPTGFTLNIITPFLANGGSGVGGLTTPSPSLLGDLAITNATQDYFFTQTGQNTTSISSMKFTGLSLTKGYQFQIFGCRIATGTRTSQYTFTGAVSTVGTLTTTGTNLSGTGINGNIATLYSTPIIYADANGEIRLDLGIVTGGYAYINLMRIQEYTAPIIHVTGVTVSGNPITTDQGTSQMTATMSPANATIQGVTWKVDNTAIATISTTGVLTGKTNGTVVVTATSIESGSIVNSLSVAVSNQLTKFPVTLQVIDQTLGVKTNKLTDNNETNVITYLSAGLVPTGWTNWWYPMYSGEAGVTGAQLVKNAGDWTWQATLQALPGTYQWNPYMKTLGWASMNKRVIYYGDTDNQTFTISSTGVITGSTQVVISATKFPVTLKIIDRSKGVKTNDPTNNNETNIYLQGGTVTNFTSNLYTESIQPTGDWWYAMYPGVARCTGAVSIAKSDSAWVWSATINASTGCYGWKPGAKSTGWTDINASMYVYNAANANIQFNVALDGTVNGQTALVIPADVATKINNTSSESIRIVPTLFTNQIAVSGAKSSIEMFNSSGVKVATKTASPETILTTTNLPKGIYILVVDKNLTYKVVK